MTAALEPCRGCGGLFAPFDGPVHDYMESSPACWRAFGHVLAAEYSTPELLPVHRLSVDTYAVQHPGGASRQAIQSVGLHLARLYLQLEHPRPPKETNEVMRAFAGRKESLTRLTPPEKFSMTLADVAPFIGAPPHAAKTMEWARAAWNDWSGAHEYIKRWATAA
ncbi:MAG TPA: hypothetical protein DEA50_16610 [Parvularcula sp.]|nr:hypothetical protein [Parvularcula sp.]